MPSSFTRKAPPSRTPLPPNTLPSPSSSTLPILSTGIPSLDDLLGGGQPLGTVLGITAPDVHSAWGKLVARYYVAQGLALGQDVLLVGGEGREELEEVVRGCMWVEESARRVAAVADANRKDPAYDTATAEYDHDHPQVEEDSDAEGLAPELEEGNRTRIAWRYDRMKKFQTSVRSDDQGFRNRNDGERTRTGTGTGNGNGNGAPFHLPLTLTTPIPSSSLTRFLGSGQLSLLPLDSVRSDGDSSPGETFKRVLREIRERSREGGEGGGRKKVLRIVVYELGGPDWGVVSSGTIHRFLHSLRHLIRIPAAPAPDSQAQGVPPLAVLITLPAHLSSHAPPPGVPSSSSSSGSGSRSGKGTGRAGLSTDAWLKSLGTVCDASVELQGFASDPSLTHSFPHSHGLVHLRSFPTLHTLLPATYKHSTLLGLGAGSTGQNNLSFRLKRKRFVLETLHLGIEGGTGERRTEPPKGMGVGGGAQNPTHTHTHNHNHGHAHTNETGVERADEMQRTIHGIETRAAHRETQHPNDEPDGRDEDGPLKRTNARFAKLDISIQKDDHDHDHRPGSAFRPGNRSGKERKKVGFVQPDLDRDLDF